MNKLTGIVLIICFTAILSRHINTTNKLNYIKIVLDVLLIIAGIIYIYKKEE